MCLHHPLHCLLLRHLPQMRPCCPPLRRVLRQRVLASVSCTLAKAHQTVRNYACIAQRRDGRTAQQPAVQSNSDK